MRDSEFKIIDHTCLEYEVFSRGAEIEKNYSPDFSLKSKNNYIFIEHETDPNRKTIIADIFKAAYFLQNEKEGIVIIVLKPKSSLTSYVKHVAKYCIWLQMKTNLKDVFFIDESKYYSNQVVLEIHSEKFIEHAISVNSSL
ncbi:hypothetical protein [Flavobacterium sp. 3HN19-14]|uniref:hypothetical protein n=1 Tax=Flavobacterium sp. 3HN19-14 TaxID=3448133 RepID=UPI003EE26700